jgi:hypothetical protein
VRQELSARDPDHACATDIPTAFQERSLPKIAPPQWRMVRGSPGLSKLPQPTARNLDFNALPGRKSKAVGFGLSNFSVTS